MVVFNKLKYIFRYKISTNTAKKNIDYIRKHLDKYFSALYTGITIETPMLLSLKASIL